MATRKRWPYAAAALFISSCGGFIAFAIHISAIEDALGALGPACEGKPVAAARPYTKGASGHAFAVFFPHKEEHWRDNINKHADDVREPKDADTVVCVDKEESMPVGTCAYYRTKFGLKIPGSDKTFTRKLSWYEVRVVAAQSGTELTRGRIWGTSPRACTSYSGKSPSQSTFEGADPDTDAIAAWTGEYFKTGAPPKTTPKIDPEDGEAAGDDNAADTENGENGK